MAPSGRLDQERVVRAAMDVLDRDGPDGFTMRKLAAELDAAPMAAYQHVRDKQDLFDAVVDQLSVELRVPDMSLPWRDRAAAAARSLRELGLRHPGAVQLLTRHRKSVAVARAAELHIAILLDAGMDLPTAVVGYRTLLHFTLGHTIREASWPDAAELRAEYVALDAERFPAHRGAAEMLAASDQQALFEGGLELILDGLEAQLRKPPGADGP